MKVLLFASQLLKLNVMTKDDIAAHEKLVIFLIMFYIRPWTEALLISLAPSNDLDLIKILFKFDFQPMHDMKKEMLDKLFNHLWYLSDELSFFPCFVPVFKTQLKKNVQEL